MRSYILLENLNPEITKGIFETCKIFGEKVKFEVSFTGSFSNWHSCETNRVYKRLRVLLKPYFHIPSSRWSI